MVLASLCVIAVTLVLLFRYQIDSKESQIKSEGISLARALARLPLREITAENQHSGLGLLQHYRNRPHFAYIAIVDSEGNILQDISSPGVMPPFSRLPTEPATWAGERLVIIGQDREIFEFYAPVLSDGALAAHVRVGYFKPKIGLAPDQITFLATLALPIFLLTPLFYFMFRSEVQPLQTASSELHRLVEKGSFDKVELPGSGQLGGFVERFNDFVNLAQQRIDELERDQNQLLTSAKLQSYKSSRIETVLSAMPEAILVLDDSGKINYANDRVATLLGVSREAVVSQPVTEWCKDPEVLDLLAHYDGSIAGVYLADTMQFHPAEATEKRIGMKAFPMFDGKDGSTIIGTLIVFRDVTRESLAKRSRGEFVAHLAHELKTPLNTLLMYSESLLADGADDEAFRIEAVNVIRDEVERLATLIDNLLSLTKIEMGSMSLERERVRLKDLLEDTFSTMSRSCEKRDITFDLELPREISAVSIDKDLMRVAINNLLSNAIKYNKPEGKVSLSLE